MPDSLLSETMAESKLFSSLLTMSRSLFLLLPFFASPAFADVSPTSPVSPETICKSTPDPSYCNTLLPHDRSANVYDHGRFAIRQSLSASRDFSSLIENYLNRRSSLSNAVIRPLQDCQFLAGLNIDFLLNSFITVNTTAKILPSIQADDVQTLLSAILTNQQTCLDGLQSTASAWIVNNGFSSNLSNGSKLYSLSLALFTKGWVPVNRTGQPVRNHLTFRNGRLPLKMSSENRRFYDSVRGRKLLQTGNEEVLVSGIVVVSKDGSGNFTTVNDAVTAAPINANGSNGYFLIYVTAGVYEEYVLIASNKKYLMMIGDGINRTIITGNRSVADGWTTFNSATQWLSVSSPSPLPSRLSLPSPLTSVSHFHRHDAI